MCVQHEFHRSYVGFTYSNLYFVRIGLQCYAQIMTLWIRALSSLARHHNFIPQNRLHCCALTHLPLWQEQV